MDTKALRITFIGGGNMAAAIMAGLSKLDSLALQLHVVDRNLDKCQRFANDYAATFSLALTPADLASDVIVLAIKPQQLQEVAAQIAPHLQAQLVISVAAGVSTGKLSAWLSGYRQIVWVMPNTPAQVGAGVSGLYATPEVSPAARELAGRLFDSVGACVWLNDEAQMDKLTAISGCGPAYVFYMVEALENAARELGFDAETAAILGGATFAGAVKLLASAGETPAALRAKVTSKKGVTEQGILSMQADDLFGLVTRAARKAEARSVELGASL